MRRNGMLRQRIGATNLNLLGIEALVYQVPVSSQSGEVIFEFCTDSHRLLTRLEVGNGDTGYFALNLT